jgi:hypothetical protein
MSEAIKGINITTTNTKELIKDNEALQGAFGFLYSTKRADFMQGLSPKESNFNGMCGHVLLEDVFVEELYSEEEFNKMVDFIFEPESDDLFIEMIKDGYVLPACIKGVDMKLPVEYEVREAKIK